MEQQRSQIVPLCFFVATLSEMPVPHTLPNTISKLRFVNDWRKSAASSE
jgi:hypothetical protein